MSAGKNTGDPLITGGTFSSDVSTYVSKSAAISTDSGKTVVTLKPSDNAVASVVKNGQTLYYTSLNDAVAEARDGETVEVLESTTISSALEIKNNITIDGNGNTVTADKCVGLYIKADLSKLTVTDLTLKGVLPEGSLAGEGGTGSFMGIGTYNGCYGVGDLQLTNVTIDGFSYGLYFGKNPAGGNGPYNENPVSVTANNLTVQNCYIKGAYFEKLTDSTFTSCKFLNNGTDDTKVESGFRTWMCGVDINLKNGSYKNISFVGCTFTNNGANSGTALLIKARDDGNYGETTSLDGATVSGCTFANNHGTTPVILGEPGKGNKTPVNVSIQSDVKYTSNVAAASNFTVTFNSNGGTEYATQLVEADSEIILPTPSKSGYIFLGWRCGENTYNAGATVKVTADMAFSAVWGNLPDVKPDTKPDQPVVTEFPFYDVAASAWYYDAVKYVYDKGLMDGVDTHEFAPNATLTRAMVWTILARAEGVDTTGGSTWYAKAQEWVVAKGVSDGENPNAAITRQELVTMLYRLAGSPTVTGSLTAPDASSVSSWAKDAMLWAMNLGLVEGDENGAVTPTATATRAQAAALIMRYTAK
ncbi:MAG: S-layer homology domain-containing protein [Oscillospiraceae bacterium]|nr:S-layer homology domain-containing protein [Oscillospiraceae bacterium]